MTSCWPKDKTQLEVKIRLLKECVGNEHPVGLEIGLGMDDLNNPSMLKKIKANLEELPDSVYLSLHGPYDFKKGSKRNFFQSEEGFANLLKTTQLADEIKAELINIHANRFISYMELKKKQSDLISFKEASIQGIKRDLQRLIKEAKPSQKICIENMPYFIGVDRVIDPEEAFYELCFVDPEDFLEIANPKKNIFATIDICHLAQVYDSSQLLSQIQKLGRGLGHIHLSDLGNIWQPFINLTEEGVIPGNGRIGEKVFKELLRYFLEFSEKQDLSIVLEINDKDLTKLEESKESFGKITDWLKDLKGG